MGNYKITGGSVLSFDGGTWRIEKKPVYVIGSRISFSPDSVTEQPGAEPFEEVDAKNKLIMPGLINMHTHTYMTMMRNYADDVPFGEWLFERVMPVEDNFPKEEAYWTSMLGYAEMIRTGTTCFVDMHMYHRQTALAAREVGIRGYIGRGLVGEDLYKDGYSRFSEAIAEKEEFESDMLHFVLAPHAIYTCSPELLKQVAEEAKKHRMLKQIHLSESVTETEDCLKKHGKTPVRLLSDIGFLDSETILAHCVQMQGDDLDLIKASGASIVTNVASNAKLGNGIAPLSEMREKGINVCIGTDGAASNNTLNMFREMGLLSLMHKAVRRDPTAIPSDYIVKAATLRAAAALDNPGIGNIFEGAKADLLFVDLNALSLFPNNNILSSLCYSANGSEVESVMIDGRFVMRKGELTTIDMEKLYFETDRITKKYLK